MNNNKESSINDDDDDDILIDDSMLAEFETTGFKDKGQNSNINRSINLDTSQLNVSALCCDEEYSGFDKLTGQKWIYPSNYPVRDYQFNIIKAAILKNTLVSLPTGLGKTFIAAVLMYNFYRWYPLGKIVFTAPTRPLIAQQIEACYKINALPPEDTIEMTGSMNVTLRKENWEKKRVFFATPQVVCNDMKSGICPGKKIRCLVIDEAHKAKSNYAYCHIVSTLSEMGHRTYRILALSATPGSRTDDVVQVVKNLHIAHLELRTESSIDVAPYCHHRNINTVVVPLSPELIELRQKYIEILDSYTRKLMQLNILRSNVGNVSKGRILMIYKEFQSNSRSHPQRNYIMHDLVRLISLYHALELLVSHGSRAFLKYFNEHLNKTWIESDARIVAMLNDLNQKLGIDPQDLNINVQLDGAIPQLPTNLSFGHPKYAKVKQILEDHFKKAREKNEDTRAIGPIQSDYLLQNFIFCEYHETVNLVQCLLLQCRPIINSRTFVGQGAGKSGRTAMSQKEQLEVMRLFRAGVCNVLVATCVAEEGLDVGAVDLIVCFDVATRSPVRLVQRCGRTGRERTGQVHFLVTEGKEHQTLVEGMRQRDTLKRKILQSKEVQQSLYTLNPRLIPDGITPKCEKMFITVKKPATSSVKCMLEDQRLNKKKITKKNRLETEPIITTTSPNKKPNAITVFLSTKKEDSRKSAASTQCSDLSPIKTKYKEKSKQSLAKSNKKNADIRAMFLGANKSKQGCAKLVNEILSENVQMSTQSLNLFVNLAVQAKSSNACYICTNICNCDTLQKSRKKIRESRKVVIKIDSEYTFPDISLIDEFNIESIAEYAKSAAITNAERDDREDNKSMDDIHNDSFFPSQHYDQNVNEVGDKDETNALSHNFDIGDVDDIFVLSPREEEAHKLNEKIQNDFTIPSINFDLGSVDDILEGNIENDNNHCPKRKERDEDVQSAKVICIIDLSRDESPEPERNFEPLRSTSPSILSGIRGSASPILATPLRKLKLKRKSVKNTDNSANTLKAAKKLNLEPDKVANMSNSMLSITQTIDLINDLDESQPVTTCAKDESRLSPILTTQADKKRNASSNSKTCNDSISRTQNDVETSVHPSNHHRTPSTSSLTIKRKVGDDTNASPYFSKKPKLDDRKQRLSSTVQDKIFAVLTSNDLNVEKRFPNDVTNLNCSVFVSELDLKENRTVNTTNGTNNSKNHNLNLCEKFSYTPKKAQGITKKIPFQLKQKLYEKTPKKKKIKKNSFIDLEAEVSEDECDSGDELTDDSAGSIAEFITDRDVTPTEEDMEAHYLKSVKSPVKPGAFKIPQLPTHFKDTIIYSQFVDQDSYEMDSFCVDSHVGLTQANDLSALELAEIILEEGRKRKKSARYKNYTRGRSGDSPVIMRKNKNVRRHNVISDSEDSS